MLVLLFGILCGIVLCLLVQYIFVKKWYLAIPVTKVPVRLQTSAFSLPKELLECIRDPSLKDKKETCIGLNLLFQFIFRELRDTQKMRRWIMKRLDAEFMELLSTTTTGKLLEQIVVRDFKLGDTLPVIKEASVLDVKLKDESFIEEMALLLDVVYSGGFQLAVDVDMMFGKSAYVSVKVNKLVGKARLEMTRLPYTHWSFAFVEEPVMEFEAESQLDGRPIQQLTNLIINQLKRSVRKKHTLPYYKFRYKPFFTKPESEVATHDIVHNGNKLSVGKLRVTVIQFSRLVTVPTDAKVYCTLAIDKMPWTELMTSRRNMWIAYDCLVIKHQFETVGLTMKDDFVLDRYEEMVVVESVVPKSSADKASIKTGDVIISVNGLKITSTSMAVRVMKQAPDKFRVKVERAKKINETPLEEFQYNEHSVSMKDESISGGDDFINISIKSMDELKDDKFNGSDSSDTGSQRSTNSVEHEAMRFRRKRTLSPDSHSVDVNTFGPPREKEAPVIKPTKSDPFIVKENRRKSIDTNSGISDGDVDLRRTNVVPAVRDPVFNEHFNFQVEDKHKYLNVCLWCRQPKKLDKQNRVLQVEKDVLLGHTSIPLMNIALECLTTLAGDFLTSYHISPAKSRNSRVKQYPTLATHKGYDDNLCHGDVTLSFLHSTKALSKSDRKKILEIKRKTEVEAEQKAQELNDKKPEDSLKRLNKTLLKEGNHRFVGIKFTGATFCNFCHKKIWFKNGYKCEVCSLICHKKCTDRSQSQTLCTESGFKFKDPQALVASAQQAVKQVKHTELIQVVSKPSIFNRFRRSEKSGEKSKEAPEVPPRPDLRLIRRQTEEAVILPTRKRSNSLTDLTPTGSDNDFHSCKAEGQEGQLHKTRSSTSLDDLKKSGSGSDTDQDMNLVRYYEQQKYTARSDEQVVTRAKEMGKELYSDLPSIERREKLDATINKLQTQIDEESEQRTELAKEEKAATDVRLKRVLRAKIEKCDDRVQSLAVLMLHYCAGLQHCMEELEAGKSAQLEAERTAQFDNSSASQDEDEPFYNSPPMPRDRAPGVDLSPTLTRLQTQIANQSDQSLLIDDSDHSLSEDEDVEKLRTEIEHDYIESLDSGKYSVATGASDSTKSEPVCDSSIDISRKLDDSNEISDAQCLGDSGEENCDKNEREQKDSTRDIESC